MSITYKQKEILVASKEKLEAAKAEHEQVIMEFCEENGLDPVTVKKVVNGWHRGTHRTLRLKAQLTLDMLGEEKEDEAADNLIHKEESKLALAS